ncbi:helix-turn-helix domain-containing protein [Paenibacillus sp. GCM10027626]|uniref:helix-turn-helix domain-containing protein n=1 Tax=Paenibacillus sp. GCM10027626 TaxID=3273411 RepID=UPI00363C577C
MTSASVVQTCGYSYHTQQFSVTHTPGLTSYLLRLQTEGMSEAIILSPAIKVRLYPGDLLLLAPGASYELHVSAHRSDNRNEPAAASGDYYIHCTGEWIDEWWQRSAKPPLVRIDPDEKLLGLWRHLIVEQRRQPEGSNQELCDYLLRSICLSLERAIAEALAPAAAAPFPVLRMKRYIEENALSRFRIEEAAQYAGLSVSRAVHLFKQYAGQSMMAYATEIRLSAAIERMKYTTRTLQQIAENCGFGEYSYFHKVFKRHYGSSPGIYRQTMRPDNSAADESD